MSWNFLFQKKVKKKHHHYSSRCRKLKSIDGWCLIEYIHSSVENNVIFIEILNHSLQKLRKWLDSEYSHDGLCPSSCIILEKSMNWKHQSEPMANKLCWHYTRRNNQTVIQQKKLFHSDPVQYSHSSSDLGKHETSLGGLKIKSFGLTCVTPDCLI